VDEKLRNVRLNALHKPLISLTSRHTQVIVFVCMRVMHL